MGLYGPIATLWNGCPDQLKIPEDQLKLHGSVHITKETCVCGFKMSKKWSFRPIRNDARPIVAAGRPHMDWSGGSYLMFRRKPMVPRESLIVAIGYKYNAQKVLYFIVTEKKSSTKTGINYLYKYPDQFTNVAICPVARPLFM